MADLWTDELTNTLTNLYRRGYGVVRIGAELGLHPDVIHRKLKEVGPIERTYEAEKKARSNSFKGPKFEEQMEDVLSRYREKYEKEKKIKWHGRTRKIKEVSKCFLVLDGNYPVIVNFITDIYLKECKKKMERLAV